LNISTRIKRENSKMTRTILTSLLIILLMPYMVYVLNQGGIFSKLEYYFALGCTTCVDILLFINMLKCYDELFLNYSTYGRKLKIKEGLFSFIYSVSLDKIEYIEVIEKKKMDFEIVMLIKKGKFNKRFIEFNIGYVKTHQQYKGIYEHMLSKEKIVNYHCVIIEKGSSKKFTLLYLIFKNSYNCEMSPRALEYVKKFMEEYNIA
jgi:hypothetical protein